MKLLLLVPLRLSDDRQKAAEIGRIPKADYDALSELVRSLPGGVADILHRGSVARESKFTITLVQKLLGSDWALALLGFAGCRNYDAVFSHSEAVGVPFSLLLGLRRRRPRHVVTAYYLTGRRNALWFRYLKLHRMIDRLITLSKQQYETGLGLLGIPQTKLIWLEECGYVDDAFFSDPPEKPVNDCQICSTGLEFRDYATLLEAVAGLPHVTLKIDPSSPWSRHASDIGTAVLPPNVVICHMELGAARSLYAESAIVVISLRPNSIGAGTATMVEAMLGGKPVIITGSPDNTFAGRQDLVSWEHFVLVGAGDVVSLRSAIDRLISNRDLRDHIGASGCTWARNHARREVWLGMMMKILTGGA